jgi:hypothetical protein
MFSKIFSKFEQINFEKDVSKFLYKNKNEKMEIKKQPRGGKSTFQLVIGFQHSTITSQ